MKREGKTLTNHSTLPDLGSALWTLRNFARDFKKDQKGLIKGEDLTLIEQTTQLTHTPSYREKYQKIERLSPTFFSGAKNSLVTYRSRLYRDYTSSLACQDFDFNSAAWFSDSQHVSSSWYLRTMGMESNRSFQQTVVEQERMTNP